MSRLYHLDATATKEGKGEYHFVLDYLMFKDGGTFIAYCPALDISSSGDTHKEAEKNFYEMFQLHIECCIEAGTLHQDLLAHGWKMEKDEITPPSLITLIKKPEVEKIFTDNVNFERISAPTVIPAFS